MDTISRFFFPLLLFLLTLAFGFWVSKVGRPYNGALFNIHKLAALGAVVFAVIQISKIGVDSSPLLVAALVVTGLCVVALFVSGAFLSIGKLDYALTLTVHRVTLAVLAIASVMMVYLLDAGAK